MGRMEKVNQLFKREISSMLLVGDLSDPRLKSVTITFADVSKDLGIAHIGFSILSDNPMDVSIAQEGLDSARGRVRKLIGERVDIRYIPEIKFVYDNSISHGLRMTRTLDEISHGREGDAPPEDAKVLEKDQDGK